MFAFFFRHMVPPQDLLQISFIPLKSGALRYEIKNVHRICILW
jgi:hypothetical protein